jgi:hypothetical protein
MFGPSRRYDTGTLYKVSIPVPAPNIVEVPVPELAVITLILVPGTHIPVPVIEILNLPLNSVSCDVKGKFDLSVPVC